MNTHLTIYRERPTEAQLHKRDGQRAVCVRGIIGTVTHATWDEEDGVITYHGVTEFGRPWQSIRPTWIKSKSPYPTPEQVEFALKELDEREHVDGMNGCGLEQYKVARACIHWALGLGPVANVPYWLRGVLKQ